MKIIPITDRSPDTLQSIVSEHFFDDFEQTIKLLQKVPNPYYIMDGSETIGYLNLKKLRRTIYIPIYLKRIISEACIHELAINIQSVLQNFDYEYFVIVLRKAIPGFLNSLMPDIIVEDTVRDYQRTETQALFEVGKSEYRWSKAVYDVSALKALHADAYAYEKDYVIGTWDDLIDQFFSSQTPKIIVTCHIDDRLLGSAIGYVHDSHSYIYSICVAGDYQGKGIGSGLMRRFINESLGKRIELRVYSKNERAVTMYEHFGFQFMDLSTLIGINKSV